MRLRGLSAAGRKRRLRKNLCDARLLGERNGGRLLVLLLRLVGPAGTGCGAAGFDCSSGAALLASEVSILVGSRVAPAIAAMTIDRTMNAPPRIEVERVRKSAAPRAVMKPDELPPTPRPPPSERCIRMTPTSEMATSD